MFSHIRRFALPDPCVLKIFLPKLLVLHVVPCQTEVLTRRCCYLTRLGGLNTKAMSWVCAMSFLGPFDVSPPHECPASSPTSTRPADHICMRCMITSVLVPEVSSIMSDAFIRSPTRFGTRCLVYRAPVTLLISLPSRQLADC